MAEIVGKFFVRNNTRIKNIIVSSKIELIKKFKRCVFQRYNIYKENNKQNKYNLLKFQ